MEWRKDKVTAEELERKRAEYTRTLMEMAKRAQTSNVEEVRTEAIEEFNGTVEEIPVEAEETFEETTEEAKKAFEETTEEAEEAFEETIEEAKEVFEETTEETEEAFEEATEEAEEAFEETTEEAEEAFEETAKEAPAEQSFGVFTADEILSGDFDGGFDMASEIIEEIARKKELMKELAEENERDCDCDEIPEIADAQDMISDIEICPKCGRRKNINGRHG